MSTITALKGASWKTYLRVTRTATYGYLASLPLLVLYETLILVVNRGHVAQVRVGAEVWMKHLLALAGIPGLALFGAVVLLGGLAVFLYERKKHVPIRPRYFGWIVLESAIYAILVGAFVSSAVGMIFTVFPVAPHTLFVPQGGLAVQSTWMKVALSIGAGLYEELLFRVLLVGGMFLVLKRLIPGSQKAYLIAAVVGALLFSTVHYVGALGDPFTLPSFTFRFIFGLVLNGLFLVRGFAVAAWTHALYDVMVVAYLVS